MKWGKIIFTLEEKKNTIIQVHILILIKFISKLPLGIGKGMTMEQLRQNFNQYTRETSAR